MRLAILAAAALIAASPVLGATRRAAPPPPTPKAGAAAFFNAYLKATPFGIPDAGKRSRLMPFVTEHLYGLLQEGDRAETRYAEATKHEVPPLLEGDIFTSLFEGANSFTVGACMATGETTASCEVNLSYRADGMESKWTDTVLLVREGHRYRLDDVAYGGAWAFGNKGKLSEAIADAIAESAKPVN